MSVFGSGSVNNQPDLVLEDVEEKVLQSIVMAEITAGLNEEEMGAFLESEEYAVLAEANRFKKNTLIRLNKSDDLERRTSMAALALAKESNSTAYKQYEKYMKLAKKAKKQILLKYDSKGERIAKKAQQVFIKNPGLEMTAEKFKSAKA
jgi:hypothetical protein